MTDENIKRLTRWKIKRSWTIKGNIFDAVKHLKNPQVKDIKSYLDRNTLEEIEKLYSAGQIDANQKSIEQKRRKIRRETIQRNLKKLIKMRIIEHNGKTYSIAHFTRYRDGITTNPEFFAEDLIQSLMHFPFRSIEEGIPEMIKRFGIFIGLCFLESVILRFDKIDSGLPHDKRSPLSAEEKDELISYWVHRAIPIGQMFDLFLSTTKDLEGGTCNNGEGPRYD